TAFALSARRVVRAVLRRSPSWRSRMSRDEPIRLSTKSIDVALDPATGAVLQVTNRLRNIDLVRFAPQRVPWRVEIADGVGSTRWIETFNAVDQSVDANGVRFRWS